MAQNVAKPRIYINIPEWLASTGTVIDPVFYTLPVSPSNIVAIPDISAVYLTNPYIAILGHSASAITLTDSTTVDIINGTIDSTLEGFSIVSTDIMPTEITFDSGNAGSILLGTFYDFPHSPDLNLSLSYSYDGIKETTTKGGATLTNAFYTKPPKWGNGLGAWELGGTAAHAKSGRRIWDLSFSYLADSSVFPTNAGLVNEDATTTNTLLVDDSFQRCIHLLNGGQIPFIFQPDNTSGSEKPDSFAIAKLDMKSFQFTQSAPNLYNVKVRIKEIW